MPRQKANIHYLYKTTCLITGRYYIGMHSTCNLEDGYMGSGKRLRYSLRKHGVENHKVEIITFFESRELLIEAEKKAITADMIADTNCMNLKEGGSCWPESANKNFTERLETDEEFFKIHSKRSSKTLKKTRKAGRIINPDWTGKKHSDETKSLISKTKKGKQTGADNSQYGTCWVTKDGINKKIKKEELSSWVEKFWIKGRN